jgi:hypothetical protein
MKQLYLQVIVDLPDDAFKANDIYAHIQGPWNELLAAMARGLNDDRLTFAEDGRFHYVAKAEQMEVRTKATRKPRKNKQDTVRLVETPPDEAA